LQWSVANIPIFVSWGSITVTLFRISHMTAATVKDKNKVAQSMFLF